MQDKDLPAENGDSKPSVSTQEDSTKDDDPSKNPPPAETTNPTAAEPSVSVSSGKEKSHKSKSSNAIETTKAQVQEMIDRNELDADSSSSLQQLFRENEALKEKVVKLKALLGRSAKAQRETKVELDATSKKLDATFKENERLNAKIDKLASRPTHMELLADFETNFDRALLSVGQAGGQDTAQPVQASTRNDCRIIEGDAVVDSLLMNELKESKERIEKLEKLNAALVHRSSQLENDLSDAKKSMDDLLNKLSRIELEKRMAVMEAESAIKAMQEKEALLQEMQMEIDMVTKSAQKAAQRAAVGEEIMKTDKSDKVLTQQLESKVQALQEWAIASNQAKTLAQERVKILENQLRRHQAHQQRPSTKALKDEIERILDSRSGSLVIGAGDVGARAFVLDTEFLKSVNQFTEHVVLRWSFDLMHEEADILFSILKGDWETSNVRKGADNLIAARLVTGGAGGETDNAFSIGQACTLVWDNTKSWIRPKTVKFKVEAVVLSD